MKDDPKRISEISAYLAQIEVNGDIVWECDLKEKSVYFSDNFSVQFGYYGEEIPDTVEKMAEVFHPEDMELLKVVVTEHVKGDTNSYIIEQRIRIKNGNYKWVLNRGKVVKTDHQGNIEKIIGTFTDITFIKEIQQALLAAKQEAEAASKVKNLFLANMSHELRTPMNGIYGMIQLLEVMGVNEEQRECLAIMKDSSKRMIALINNLMDLTSIEAGSVDADESSFRIEDIIEEIMGRYLPEAQNKDLKLSCIISPDVPHKITGDFDKIRSILGQFTDNAIKFTDCGSIEISISKASAEDSEIPVIDFSVKDTGIGISRDDADKLFKSFSQLDDSYTKRFQGAGLGLAICKRLAEILSAEIKVKSTPGEGSTFTLHMKLDSREEGNSMKERLAGKKILIADDDETGSLLLGILCEKFGLSAVFAEDGAKAVQLHKENLFDLVFMDIQMPQLSGISAAKMIREIDSGLNRRTNIIAVTAYALKGDRERFISEGMDDYLSKPVDSEVFSKMLENWLIH